MPDETPPETPLTARDVAKTPSGKVLYGLFYVVSSATVAAVAALSGLVLVKTGRATLANAGHLISTKGKVWESSQFRNMEDL